MFTTLLVVSLLSFPAGPVMSSVLPVPDGISDINRSRDKRLLMQLLSNYDEDDPDIEEREDYRNLLPPKCTDTKCCPAYLYCCRGNTACCRDFFKTIEATAQYCPDER